MSKKYGVKEKFDKESEKEFEGLNPLVSQLLYNRNIKKREDADRFLNPDFDNHLHDPFLLPDMQKSVLRILLAIETGEKIGIWSDYDADGIPGGAILHDFFNLIGYYNFINYIPDRHTEGYGLNIEGIKELKEAGVSLLITIDCGIRDIDKIKFANDLKIDVIVTDHHEQGEILPEAYAIVNPKLNSSEYPEKILCGSGVIWKFIEAILKTKRDFKKDGEDLNVSVGKEKWLLDLVGLATLSDMVPLVGENRVLAKFGLSVLRKNRRPGFRKLFSLLKINKEYLNEDDIGFLVTPRINAASRMGHPRDAFKMLVAKNEEEAHEVVHHLDNINKERKTIVAQIVKEAHKKVKEKFQDTGETPVIVLGNPDWRPALLGLAANSIAEMYGRPVFLWGREGGEFIKGSCRSDGVTDLVAIMERAKDHLLEFGGHKLSGGFSVDHTKIHHLEDALIDASRHTVLDDAVIEVDKEILLSDINREFVNHLNTLSPFGVGNEKPIFMIRDVLPEKIARFGKAKEHLSVSLRQDGTTSKAISFFASPDQFGDALVEGIKTNAIVHVEDSYYNGRSEIRLRIVDFFV